MKKKLLVIFLMSCLVFSLNGVAYHLDLETTGSNTDGTRTDMLHMPRLLTTSTVGRDVTLRWQAPGTIEGGMFTHTQSGMTSGWGHPNGAIDFEVAHRFTPQMLADLGVAGAKLTEIGLQVSRITGSNTINFQIQVWTGGSASPFDPGELIHYQAFAHEPLISGDMHEVTLNRTIIIPADKELWIGYRVWNNGGGDFPTGMDGGPGVEGFGNLIRHRLYAGPGTDVWQTLSQATPEASPNRNWVIRGYAEVDGARVAISPIRYQDHGIEVDVPKQLDNSRTLRGYRVWREDTELTTTPITGLYHVDRGVALGVHNYRVVAVYEGGNSEPARAFGFVGFYPPRNLTGKASSFRVDLEWEAANAVDASIGTLLGYRVYRNDRLITGMLTDLNFTDEYAYNDNTYTYHVVAVYRITGHPDHESEPTTPLTVKPEGDLIFPPRNLMGVVEEHTVALNWDAPSSRTGFFSHGGLEPDGRIGNPNVLGNWTVVHRFAPIHLVNLGVSGQYLTQVSLIVGEAATHADYTLRIWTGGAGAPVAEYYPGNLVYEKSFIPPVNDAGIIIPDWFTIPLETPVFIAPNQELWIGYNARATRLPCHPLMHTGDVPPMVNGFGNLTSSGGSDLVWYSMFDNNPGLGPFNWAIRGYAADASGNAIMITNHIEVATEVAPVTSNVGAIPLEFSELQSLPVTSIRRSSGDGTRALVGYNVYRGTELLTINPIPANELTYLATDVPAGNQTFHVRAVYATGESAPTSTTVFVREVITINEFPYEESFDASAQLPAGWRRFDIAGSDAGWTVANIPAEIIHGPRFMQSVSRQGVNNLTPDNRLITPKLAIPTPAEGNFILTYYIGRRSPVAGVNDYYSLEISTSTIALENFTIVRGTEVTDTAWELHEFDLSPWHGQTIYISFRNHNVTGAGMLKMDRVRVGHINDIKSDDDNVIEPLHNALLGNFPNPFNPSTVIEFGIRNSEFGSELVNIEVFNVRGQKVKTLVNDYFPAGRHSVTWEGTDDSGRMVGSGVYFYRMTTGEFSETRRMLLMK